MIRLYYNPRKELLRVPNVEGQPLADAQRILSPAGFKVGDRTTSRSSRATRSPRTR